MTPQPPVQPASDEEIADLEKRGESARIIGFVHPLIARIRADEERHKREIAELESLIQGNARSEVRALRVELTAQGDIVAQLHKELVNANAAIARMKAGHDEIIEARTALRLIPLRAELAASREEVVERGAKIDRLEQSLAFWGRSKVRLKELENLILATIGSNAEAAHGKIEDEAERITSRGGI